MGNLVRGLKLSSSASDQGGINHKAEKKNQCANLSWENFCLVNCDFRASVFVSALVSEGDLIAEVSHSNTPQITMVDDLIIQKTNETISFISVVYLLDLRGW